MCVPHCELRFRTDIPRGETWSRLVEERQSSDEERRDTQVMRRGEERRDMQVAGENKDEQVMGRGRERGK